MFIFSRNLHRHMLIPLVVCIGVGCAQLPEAQGLRLVKAPAPSSVALAQQLPHQEWPRSDWWSAYGDPQLGLLIEEALKENPDLAVADARLKQVEAMGQIIGAATKPQVGLNANITSDKQSYNYLSPKEALPQGWNDYGFIALNMRYELDFWGRNRAALKAATSELEAAHAEVAQARLLIVAAVAGHYAELHRLYANHDIAVQSADLQKKLVNLFGERLKNGLEIRASLRMAEARLAATEGQVLALDEQIRLQKSRLTTLIGAAPARAEAITRPALETRAGAGLPAQVEVNLLGRRPDIVAARAIVESRKHHIAEARASFYPNVNLMAFIGVQSLGVDMLGKSGSSLGSVGPAISLPIFSGGRLRGALKTEQARYAEAVASYESLLNRALHEISDAVVNKTFLAQRIEKAGQALDAAEDAYGHVKNRYAGGMANYLEVLVAEDAYLNNRNALVNMQSLACVYDINLKRALGGGYQVTTE